VGAHHTVSLLKEHALLEIPRKIPVLPQHCRQRTLLWSAKHCDQRILR
jgi:hypothetical protein